MATVATGLGQFQRFLSCDLNIELHSSFVSKHFVLIPLTSIFFTLFLDNYLKTFMLLG